MSLALSLENAKKKANLIDRAMRYWILRINAESARQWLEQSPLPSEQKEQYLNWCQRQLGPKEE